MEYILHVGHFKTATKYIQGYLRSQRKKLAAEKVLFVPKWGFAGQKPQIDDLKDFINNFDSNNIDTTRLTSLKNFVASLADQHKFDQVFFSNESLLVPMLPMSITFEEISKRLYGLREIFQPNQIKILITIRRQDSFIESTYTQRIKEFATYSFSEFLSKFDMSLISHYKIAKLASEIFGKENIKIIPYELTKPDSKVYMAAVLSAFQRKTLNVDAAGDEGVNYGLSDIGIKILINAHKLLSPDEALPIRKVVQEHYSNLKFPKPKLLSEEKRFEIMNYHSKENEKLFIEFIPDSDPFLMGYSLKV